MIFINNNKNTKIMRKKLALAALVYLGSSTDTYADWKSRASSGVNRAKSSVSQGVDRQRERAESLRDATRSRVQNSADRARNSLNDTRERAERSLGNARSRAEDYYHRNIEERIREETRRFEEDPKGYSLDLGRRMNDASNRFEDVASEGIAEGFISIEYQRGKRLGSLLESKFGIPEDRTKQGVKFGVLYLMGHNPTYIISGIQIVQDAQGRLLSIEEAKTVPSLRPKAVRLESYIIRMAESYQRKDIDDAMGYMQQFSEEIQGTRVKSEEEYSFSQSISNMYDSVVRELNRLASENGNRNIGEYIVEKVVIKPMEYAVGKILTILNLLMRG